MKFRKRAKLRCSGVVEKPPPNNGDKKSMAEAGAMIARR